MSETPILDSIERLARAAPKKNWKTTRPLLGRDDNKFRKNYDSIFRKKKSNANSNIIKKRSIAPRHD